MRTNGLTKRLYIIAAYIFISLSLHAQGDGLHVRLTNLPHVYINTFTGQSVTSTTAYVYARMWYVGEDDNVETFDSLQIRVRGNSTANLAKKPYKLKFNEKVKLLGKGHPNTKKWTMLANHCDKTMIRNVVTSLIGERAGLKFNPAAKFVDLSLNGSYVGTYQISDQIDVRPHRVDIKQQDSPLTSASNITGGYLLEADGFRDFSTGGGASGTERATGFYSSHGVPVRIHYPDDDEITNRQVGYITNYVNNFETRLFGNNFTDATTGYRPLVDSLSLIRWYLCTEISANVDGFFSAYFYKEQDDPRLFFGPLWDYDIAYDNDNRARLGTNSTVQQLMFRAGYGSGWGNGNRDWVSRMWQDPWFSNMVNREYRTLVEGGLETFLNYKIDSLTTLLNQSQRLNFQRWGISQSVLREKVLHSTYAEYTSDLRTFIKRHLIYLSSAFATLLPAPPEPEHVVKQPDFVADGNYFYTIRNVNTSTCIDIDIATNNVCCNQWNSASATQQWRLYNLENGYFFIRNAQTWTALSDPSPEGSTATTNVGANLVVASADSTDARQQWDVVKQSDGTYNLISRSSQHAANLSGGNATDGAHVLSYTSDNRNATSGNRLWRIAKGRHRDLTTPIDCTVATDYALAYDHINQRLHFGADDMSQMRFTATVYDQSGSIVGSFPATSHFSTATLPHGIYLVSWQHDGRLRTVKFVH